METNYQKQLLHMTAIEMKAQEILIDKNDSVSLDMRRNLDREALRALEKTTERNVWTMVGSSLVKLPVEKAKELLEKDLKEANIEINKIRSNLKVKVNELRDLEYQDKYTGFSLNALSQKELSAMKQVWGESSS